MAQTRVDLTEKIYTKLNSPLSAPDRTAIITNLCQKNPELFENTLEQWMRALSNQDRKIAFLKGNLDCLKRYIDLFSDSPYAESVESELIAMKKEFKMNKNLLDEKVELHAKSSQYLTETITIRDALLDKALENNRPGLVL